MTPSNRRMMTMKKARTKNKSATGGRTNAAGRELVEGLRQLHHALTTGDYSKVTVRKVTIVEPTRYEAKDVQALRKRLAVSQSVFASLVGVSPMLVAHWEHGIREPSALARRLFDMINANPREFVASHMQRRSA